MRAVRHDRDTAIAMGVPAQARLLFTFALGFALAGLGGVVAAPITTVDSARGVDILPFCFMAVIIGGLGNLPGTAAAAILLAVLEGIITERGRADRRADRLARVDERRPAAASARLFKERPVTAAGPRDRADAAFVAFLLVGALVLPALVSTFWVSIIAEILIWSLFAASVNLLFGYVGLLVIRPGAVLRLRDVRRRIGDRHVGPVGFWPALRARHRRRQSRWRWWPACFAVRLTWHYFAIITVVFSLIFYFLAMTIKWLTGGDDGISFSLPPTFSARQRNDGASPTRRSSTISSSRSSALCFYADALIVIEARSAWPSRRSATTTCAPSLIGINVYLPRLDGLRDGGRSRRVSRRAVCILRPLRLGVLHVLSRLRRSGGLGDRRRRRHACSVRSSAPACSSSSARSCRRSGSTTCSSSVSWRSWW